jgi:DNA-binding response OmpR family regulator
LYIYKRKCRFIPFNGITFHATSAIFYYRGKPLDTLEDAELLILEYLVQNRYRFVSLNELNHLYENEVNKNNFSTVVKRREVAFASLISKLQILTATNESDILIYQKNKEDKRIKEIKLKESFIKIK